MSLPPNRATLWAQIFVDELYRAGVRQACLAPGSRSTPLTLAFASHGGFRIHSLLDERGAAFFALGLGLATNIPAAVVCTSGTAAAEFFPAVIEASQNQVPLILLTADRPAELRDSGANQSIDQINLYGRYVRWFVDAAPPEKEPPALVLRYLRAMADRAVAAAQGISSQPGPVQINFPFRKPLEPVPVVDDVPDDLLQRAPLWAGRPDNQPLARLTGSRRLADASLVEHLAETVRGAPNGLVVCGPARPDKDFPATVSALATQLGWPVLADPLSGVRFGPHTQQTDIISTYDLFLNADTPSAGMVLRFGGMPTSKALMEYLESLPSNAPQVAVHSHGTWQDSAYKLSALVAADPTDLARRLVATLRKRPSIRDEKWLGYWQQAEIRARSVVSQAEDFEGKAIAQV
ncbi:MAG: 2-succinyl-5-enolpyruvyl-6-hydroxy-3-cyclohexene-1-carboxylic-acid synthase, partial [Chloroflexi bacterium]|nr:2-succinyl-5-enolpyruvyl-6-hydroxy-3-cyclohexene-1-carboxylic-acid synthase [Chloroflexota bacterium]